MRNNLNWKTRYLHNPAKAPFVLLFLMHDLPLELQGNCGYDGATVCMWTVRGGTSISLVKPDPLSSINGAERRYSPRIIVP